MFFLGAVRAPVLDAREDHNDVIRGQLGRHLGAVHGLLPDQRGRGPLPLPNLALPRPLGPDAAHFRRESRNRKWQTGNVRRKPEKDVVEGEEVLRQLLGLLRLLRGSQRDQGQFSWSQQQGSLVLFELAKLVTILIYFRGAKMAEVTSTKTAKNPARKDKFLLKLITRTWK